LKGAVSSNIPDEDSANAKSASAPTAKVLPASVRKKSVLFIILLF
jgi:hypothetical protein